MALPFLFPLLENRVQGLGFRVKGKGQRLPILSPYQNKNLSDDENTGQ
jgi:hypothetical protein